jgi:hypothetical protein
MPSRRDVLLGGAGLFSAAALLPERAGATPRCIAAPRLGGELCKSYIDVANAYQETYHASHDPSALWIACVAVVFATYNHVIQQPRIAGEAYGAFDKVAFDNQLGVLQPLTRAWRDDDGVAFRASFEPVFDGGAPNAAFDPNRLIAAVGSGNPLILIGGEHPVVLTALAYTGASTPSHLVAGFVFDPMPLVGPRALDLDEVVPRSAGGDLLYAVRTRLEKV